jgi:hypothetical protein
MSIQLKKNWEINKVIYRLLGAGLTVLTAVMGIGLVAGLGRNEFSVVILAIAFQFGILTSLFCTKASWLLRIAVSITMLPYFCVVIIADMPAMIQLISPFNNLRPFSYEPSTSVGSMLFYALSAITYASRFWVMLISPLHRVRKLS